MPFDPSFRALTTANARLEMREKAGGKWMHIMNVPKGRVIQEKAEWERNNPGWEFKLDSNDQFP